MRKIYVNGNIYTFNEMQPNVEAVVVEDGRIIDIGNTEDMLSDWQTTDSEIIDFARKTVTPGLIDSHLHLSGIASNFLNLDLTGVTSKQMMLDKIRERASTLVPGEWLVGRGWDENLFTEGVHPTIAELNDAAPNNPIYLSRICSHASLVNEPALKVAGYHPNMHIPEGGTVVLDEQTGYPTGLILESAAHIITKHIPESTYNEQKDILRRAIQFVMSKGLTSVHTNDSRFLKGPEKLGKCMMS